MSWAMRLHAAECLAKCVPGLEQAGEGRWKFDLTNGRALPVSAHLDEEWLTLEAPAGNFVGAAHFEPLEWNGRWAGPGRFALCLPDRALRLRAEIALVEDVDIPRRVQDACAGFRTALEIAHGAAPAENPEAAGEQPPADLKSLLREAGWDFTERAAGRLAVELDAGRGFYQALAEPSPAGGTRFSVELVRSAALSPASRQALGLLLLTAGGLLRMVRPVAAPSDGHTAFHFEVSFASPPAPAEASHALAALSVGCRCCGEEAKLLCDETLAGHYLAIRSSPRT